MSYLSLEDLGWEPDVDSMSENYLSYLRDEQKLNIDLDKRKITFSIPEMELSFASMKAIIGIIIDNAIY